MDYDKGYFANYIYILCCELTNRKIKYKEKYLDEMTDFCGNLPFINKFYKEHNNRYLLQCLYNIEEKAMRGIITKEEWKKIYNKYKDRFVLWEGDE